MVAVAAALLASGSAGAQEAPPAGDERVAQVGDVAIAKADFDHWFASAANSHFRGPVELVGPDYQRCVEAKRRQRAAKRWRPLDDMELRRRCQGDHRMLRHDVLQFLIQAQWVEQEAVAQGVRIGQRGVDRLFESQKRAAFPTERAYRRFLRESSVTEADIKFRIRLDALQNRLTRRVRARGESLAGFIEGFRARYRAMTWCAPGYAIAECGAIAPAES